jgi:hypothetical protein
MRLTKQCIDSNSAMMDFFRYDTYVMILNVFKNAFLY